MAEGRSLVGAVIGERRAAAEPAAVEALVEACGRLPLAVRIAATRLVTRVQETVANLVEGGAG